MPNLQEKCTNPSGDIVVAICLFLGSWWGIQSSCQRHPLMAPSPEWRNYRQPKLPKEFLPRGLQWHFDRTVSANAAPVERSTPGSCSCSVPTLVRFPAPLHSLITGNTSLSIPGHAEILHNYLGFRTKFEQKKNRRPFAGICARFAGICARFAGTPGPRELRKPEK